MDVCYSNLPNSLKPMRGMEMNAGQPDQHAKYSFYRDISRQNRQQFIDMVPCRDDTIMS